LKINLKVDDRQILTLMLLLPGSAAEHSSAASTACPDENENPLEEEKDCDELLS